MALLALLALPARCVDTYIKKASAIKFFSHNVVRLLTNLPTLTGQKWLDRYS
jgi:hypothetical protein